MKHILGNLRNITNRVFLQAGIILGIGALSLTSIPVVHGAASASFSLTPSTASIAKDEDIIVTINVVAGSNKITGARACLTYDQAKLAFKTVNTSNSAFNIATPSDNDNCSANQIQISRFDISPKTGTITLASVTFTTKQSNTTTNIAFDNDKSYIRDNASTDSTGNYIDILSGSTGTTLTITGTTSTTKKTPTSTQSPALIGKAPAKSGDTTSSSLVQAASSDVTTSEVKPVTAVVAAKRATQAKSSTPVYLFGGVFILVLLATGLLAKFVGIPGLSLFGKKPGYAGSATGPSADVSQPSGEAPINLSHIPDPKIPPPSTVVQPTVPPVGSDEKPSGTS